MLFQAPIVNRTIFEFRRDVRNKVLNCLIRDYSFFTPLQEVKHLAFDTLSRF